MMDKICMNCCFLRQGSHLHCGHPDQNDIKKIEYTYWPFSCELYEETEFRADMGDFEKGRLGFQKQDDGTWLSPKFDKKMLAKK